jgi:transaldolase/glucose-6-phosphate isomerase
MLPAACSLGRYAEAVEARLRDWERDAWARRLWERDPTLWSSEPVPEIDNRLGWLDLPVSAAPAWPAMETFAAEAVGEGLGLVVLLGMGGSSLAPETMHRTFGRIEGHPPLRVLDSTHPDAVHEEARQADPERTLVVVSSKSGTTAETLSLFRHFWKRAADTLASPGARFVAVTDPGSSLEALAGERGFRAVFPAPPDVGGRYSALTPFGMVPAALAGIDGPSLLERAREMAGACGPETAASENPGLRLGAMLGELALAGRDKVTFLTSPALASFPDWAEQLLAESLGKEGKGLVPVAGEPVGEPGVYGEDRLFVLLTLEGEETTDLEEKFRALEEAGHPTVRIRMADRAGLGAEFFRWEVATAAAGSILGVHPFNQPDVELAKRLAREAMAEGGGTAEQAPPLGLGEPAAVHDALDSFLGSARAGDYICLQAWLAGTPEVSFALERLRLLLRAAGKLATTVGFGPRFLHSTGQLHKGGPGNGLFIQLLDDSRTDLPVPEEEYSFGDLMRAQALGDARALEQRGRRLLRISLGESAAHGLAHLVGALGG